MRDISEVMRILKGIRKKKGISVSQVVEHIQCETGIRLSEKTVYGWENASAKPDVTYFMVMCNLYQVHDIQELFKEDSTDVTLRDKLYGAYVARPKVQLAVRILLGLE